MQRVEAIHFWHLQVHERDIRMVRRGIAGSPRDHWMLHLLEVISGLNANQTGDPLAHDWMVVNRQNSNSRSAAAHDLSSCLRLPGNLRENQERL